eukprot:TRINITY_DN3188_c0_g1_i15.p1 TRINITY_DN3188_c0_g1~~TRINITY_DN3188_c0_g1_i15.p1  ORF type:complete len:2206 (+),score=1058.96 TRINITY_DN3188_c0_g1_i15:162-6779(+)
MGGDEKEDEIPQRCLVYARLRPTKALDGIGKDGVYQLVHCNKKKIILGTPEEPIKTFNFDGSFTPANTQEEIFNEVAVASLDHVLKGFTSAIMCYGQTGTGKSYTMSHKSPGQEAIIPRSANYLFAKIKDMPTKEFHLSAHFVQIYRDTLSDLMVDPKEKQKVDIRFQDKTGVEIVNCTEVPVTSTEQFMAMYEEGDARRVVRPTKMNPDSSRGHTALVLYVKSKSVDPNDMSMPANGKITFIDLAGYERFEKTGLKDPVHIDEAKKINASLLALGYVVTALSNGDKHVPWRNSKLTRLLQDSIGGKSRSTIVITCGPASTNLHESQNSFDFGNRAMAVKVAAKLDVAVDYQKLSVKLQQQLDEQEEKLSKLEKAEKERDVERAATQDRHKRDMERLRTRHKDELVKLMEEGATNERVQKLIEMQDAETETLEDMQHDEQAVQEETFQEVVKEEMNERVQRERIRGSSMRKQISDDKRKELHAAYTLIAQLRAGSADLPDDETLKKIHDEVSGLAGSAKTPALAHLLVNTGAPPAGGLTIDAPMVQETGEDEGASQATSACPSPTTVNNAEIGILKQELVDMRQQLEETEQKGKEAIEKMKVAQKKAATKLKEERERNAQLLKTTASLEKMEALEGELDEVKTAKKEAERMLEEANERVEKLEKNLNGVTARVWRTTIETKKTQAKVEALSAERDELDEKYSILEQEKAELADEFNRKKRDIEIAAEEADAGASRVHGELKNELDAAKEKIAEHEAAIEEMTQKLGAVTKELEDLSTAKDEQEAGLRAEIEAAKGEASTSAKELEEGQAALAKRAEEVEADLAARQEELDDMVETTKDEVATVRAELMKQVEDMQSRTSLEVIGLKERIDELMGEMVQLKEGAAGQEGAHAAALQAAQEKEKALQGEAAALTERIEALTADVAGKEAELEAAVGRAEQLEEEATSAGRKREAAADELAEALRHVEELSATVAERDEALAERAQRIDALSEEAGAAAAAHAAELETLRAEIDRAGAELAALRDSAAVEQGASAAKLEETQAALEAAEEAAAAAKANVEELEAAAERQGGDVDELQKALGDEQAARAADTDKAQQDHDAQAAAYAALTADKEDLDAKLSTLEATAAATAQHLEATTQQRDELQAQLDQASADLAAAEKTVEARDAALADREAAAGDAEHAHGALEAEKKELEAGLSRLQGERDELLAANKALVEQLAATKEELAEGGEREAELKADKELLEAEAEEAKQSIADLDAAIASRDEKIAALAAAGGESSEQVKVVSGERDAVKAQLEDAAKQRDELQVQLEELREKLAAAAGERDGLKKELGDTTAALDKAEEDAENAKEQLAAAKDEAAAKEEELEEKNKALEEEVEAAKEEAEDERELGKELAEEKEALQLELEEYKDQSEAALAEKERQEEELQNNVASLEDELATSGQYQEALEVRIKELEGALSELTGELNQEKSKAQVEAEAAKNKMMEERKMRDEEAERLKAEAERLKTDAAKDAEEMEKRMREEQAEAERRLKEEKEKVGGGKYKYTSKIVSQLERVGQFAIPRDAPSMARPEGLLVSLDPEEVKASLAYNLVVVGLQHSGKSSVQHCLVKGSHGLVRRAPDTTSPTTAFDLSRTVHKERSGGGGGFLGKKQASASANTHFTVWDTPCDPRHIAALPPGTLPVLGACYVVTFSLTDDFAGIAKRLEYVLQMVWANAKANMDEGMRLPVLLVGTRRDLLSSKDNVVVMKKIGEAKRWLKEAPMMRERFTLLDCFAVSCKEWSVQGDTGLKTGVSSFSQLMGFLSSDMANRYPITPPALLGEVENAGAQLDIHDWWTSLARSNPRDEADATLRAGHKAVLSLMLHLHRMRLRNVWLVGKMEFEAAVFDHIPSHVEKAQPFLKDQLKKICVQRGMAYTVLDKAMNDAREGVVLLKTDVLANFVASFLLPTVYLSNCTAFAEREKPGYLKGVLAKHAKLNIEEVWRPDWPLMFDGKVPQSTAPALMKAAPAFEKEVRLGCDFLPLLDLSFEVFSEDDNEKYQFMPAMALRHLSNTVVSMLLECFKKSNGGWIANTTKCDPLAYAETQAVLKGVHALNPGTARLWGDGAAVMVDGRWAFVRVEPAHVVICCEGKDSPLLAPLRQVVVAASAKANISDATWKDGMNLDHLPRLAPAYAKQVEDAASIEAFLAHLSADILRGTPYPQATVDKDIKRRGK